MRFEKQGQFEKFSGIAFAWSGCMSIDGTNIQILQLVQIAQTAKGFAQVTDGLAQQHATLSTMADVQAREVARKDWLAQMQQLAFAVDESMRHMAGIPPRQWDEGLWDYFMVVPAAFKEANFSPEIFPDLEYKRLAFDLIKRYSDLELKVKAEAPGELAVAETRFNEQVQAEAAAAAAREKQRQAEEAARLKREALDRSIASDAKTALTVTLIALFCFQVILPLGCFLAIRARRRAKREAPHMVPATNTAYYISVGFMSIVGLIVGLMLLSLLTRLF